MYEEFAAHFRRFPWWKRELTAPILWILWFEKWSGIDFDSMFGAPAKSDMRFDRMIVICLKFIGRLVMKVLKRFRKPIILAAAILVFVVGLDWGPTQGLFLAILDIGLVAFGVRILFLHRIFPAKKSHRK